MAAPTDVAVGIDVAKAQLDVAVEPTGETWTVPRSRGGLRRLEGRLQALGPSRIVVEASGGYERLVVATLAAAGLPVVVVNPRQTHDFARALGRLAKTDRLDAQVLARFAAEVRPPLRPQPSAVVEDLQILSRRRRQLVNDRAARAAAAAARPPPPGPGLRPPGRRADRGPGQGRAPTGGPGPDHARVAGPAPPACAASPASALWPSPPCSPSCPNWGPAPASRSRPSSASPPSIAIAAPGAGAGVAGVDAPRCAPRSTWPP